MDPQIFKAFDVAKASTLRYQTTGHESYKVDDLWHVALETSRGRVVVRPRYTDEPLDAAFRLAYDVHCVEKRLVDQQSLSVEMRASRQKWDCWDHSSQTVHLLALLDGVLIGRSRLIADGPLGLPLAANGFNLDAEKGDGFPAWEHSKLLVNKQFRASGLVSLVYWLAYQICHLEAQRPSIYLSCEPALRVLYRRIGGVEIGQFTNREFGQTYSAMRIDFVETYEKQRQGGRNGVRVATKRSARIKIDTGLLLDALSKANPAASISDWDATPLLGGGGVTTANLWKVSSKAKYLEDASQEASCIVKGLRKPESHIEVPCPHPWNHEAAVYCHSTAALPTGITVPKLLNAEIAPDQIHLFLEDLSVSNASPLCLDDVSRFARLLGVWHRAKHDPLATAGWLGWYVEAASPLVEALPSLAATVDALAVLADDETDAAVESFWSNRATALQILQSLPHVISHQDLVARNVFVRSSKEGAREHVLIDWALYGAAPIGAELAPLLFGSSLLFAWSTAEAQNIVAEVVDSYVQGLNSETLEVTANEVLTGLSLAAALRYIAWGGHRVEASLDVSQRSWAESAVGRGLPDIVQRFAEVRKVVVMMGLEALNRNKADLCI